MLLIKDEHQSREAVLRAIGEANEEISKMKCDIQLVLQRIFGLEMPQI